jgi:hypothetical protein
MTNVELINFVFEKLIAQGVQSMGDNGISCRYRGVNGSKCAAGHLIKDEFYNDSLENKRSTSEDVAKVLIDSGVPINQLELVRELQKIHDDYPPIQWPVWRAYMLKKESKSPEEQALMRTDLW